MRVGTVIECAVCAGKGVVSALHLDTPTPSRQIETCPACEGKGATIVKEIHA